MTNLNCQFPINNLSYGLVGLNIAKRLAKTYKVSLFPIGQVQLETKDDQPLVQELVNNQNEVDPSATGIRLYHQFDLVQRIGRGLHIGWPIFELDNFTEREKNNIASCDQVIVCSKWAKEVIDKYFAISCTVVPLGVDRSIFYPGESPWNYPYTFLCVGKIEVRKGHDILPKIFAKALPKGGNWKLYMLWGNPFLTKDEKTQWESYYKSILGDNVSFSDRLATQADIANEMRFADCGISLSRAEGWNLPLLELMSCGKPVITTNYSAHTEFCTPENSSLVNITDTEPAFDGKWFDGKTGSWAKLGQEQEDQAIEHIRHIYSKGKGYVNQAGIDTSNHFSWDRSVAKLLEIL